MKNYSKMTAAEKKKTITAAAKHIQKICKFEEEPPLSKKVKDIEEWVEEAAGDLTAEEVEKINKTTTDLLSQLEWLPSDDADQDTDDDGQDKDVDQDTDDDAEDKDVDWEDVLKSKKKLEDLKEIVKENDEFESLQSKKKLKKFTKPAELRKAMIAIIKQQEDVPAKEEKKTSKKPANKSAAKKGGNKKPGVIAKIVELCRAATKKNPITKDEILEELEEAFPERTSGPMKSTINVQVPNRINRERDFNLEKNKDGAFYAVKTK